MDPSVSSRPLKTQLFQANTGSRTLCGFFYGFSSTATGKKKNSANEKAESAFISTATLIDILKVEQLLSVLTTAG